MLFRELTPVGLWPPYAAPLQWQRPAWQHYVPHLLGVIYINSTPNISSNYVLEYNCLY